MKKTFILTAFIALLLASCLSEKSATPSTENIFVRYYNGGNNDQAQAMEFTPDNGVVILATTRIQKRETDTLHSKIKLIKTDSYGNPLATVFFPKINSGLKDYTGSSIISLPTGGYVIVGEDIQADKTSKVLIITVDENLNQKTLVSLEAKGVVGSGPASGKAVAVNSTGNLLVLSFLSPDKMYLSEIDKSNYATTNWSIEYASGSTNLANRLFVDVNKSILWAGEAIKVPQVGNPLVGIRMIKTPPNSVNTEFDLLISQSPYDEIAFDFCRFGYEYAITGSTNLKVDDSGKQTKGNDTDILFKRIGQDGTVLQSKSFPLGSKDSQNDSGNSISSTSDGGLILLSSVNSAAIDGYGDLDYYLIKIDAFGKDIWTSHFGSKFKDEGAVVRQTSDGGYIILGTTTQGGLKILSLIKTDANGKVGLAL